MTIITTNDALQQFVQESETAEILAVDTEFFRRYSYYPELCLIQANNGKKLVAIDVLADNIDLSPFLDLLYRKDILKIFHSASQDIEIFFRLSEGKVPTPIFDTQIACMACMGETQTSYEKITRQLLDVTLDKSMQNCDWRKRPLVEKQLTYALADVEYLIPLYHKLNQMINELGRTEWIKEEMVRLENPATYQKNPDNAWLAIRGKNLKANGLAILQNTAKLREILAIEYDVPRKHIISDDDLLAIAKNPPSHFDKLLDRKYLTMRSLTLDDKQEFFDAIADGKKNAGNITLPTAKIQPSTAQQLHIDALRLVRRVIAHELHITPKLLCEQDDLHEMILQEKLPDILSQGWRYQYFGKILEEFIAGEYRIVIEQTQLKLAKNNL